MILQVVDVSLLKGYRLQIRFMGLNFHHRKPCLFQPYVCDYWCNNNSNQLILQLQLL